MKELQLNNGQLNIRNNNYERNTIQQFHFSCPGGGTGRVMSVNTDIRAPVQFRGSDLCLEYVSFVFNGRTNVNCELCGETMFERVAGTGTNCLNEPITDSLLITFRTGYRKYDNKKYTGFNALIECTPAPSTNQEEKCRDFDPTMTSNEYLNKRSNSMINYDGLGMYTDKVNR